MSNAYRFLSSLLAVVLVLAGLALAPHVALTAEGDQNAEAKAQDSAEAPQAEEQAPATNNEIVFQGKLYAYLKHGVPLPYKGIISELLVQAGQQVKKGDPLVNIHLEPDVIVNIRRSISPDSVRNLKLQIAKTTAQIQGLRDKLNEVQQLAKQNMATGRNIQQIKTEIDLHQMQLQATKKQLEMAELTLEDNKRALEKSLGETVSFNNVPQDITLKAPTDGHVLWIHPELRSGAELGATAVMVIGVMDPMIIRAHVFEIEASRLEIGDKASVSLSSIPNQTFEATLSRISWTPVTPGLGKPSYYEVELTAPNPDFVLKEGFKTQVTLQDN